LLQEQIERWWRLCIQQDEAEWEDRSWWSGLRWIVLAALGSALGEAILAGRVFEPFYMLALFLTVFLGFVIYWGLWSIVVWLFVGYLGGEGGPGLSAGCLARSFAPLVLESCRFIPLLGDIPLKVFLLAWMCIITVRALEIAYGLDQRRAWMVTVLSVVAVVMLGFGALWIALG
jgi:hypothetical protein